MSTVDHTTEQVDPYSVDVRLLPSSFDKKTRTFDVIMSTGAAVPRYSWMRGAYEESLSLDPDHIRLERFNSGRAPFCEDHRHNELDKVAGSIVEGSVRIVNGEMVGQVRMHKTERAIEITGRMQRGELMSLSLGYITYSQEVVEKEDGPDQRKAVDWEPIELSLIPVPAETGAHTRSTTGGVSCVVRSAQKTTMGKTTAPKAGATSASPDPETRETPSAGSPDPAPAAPAAPAPAPQERAVGPDASAIEEAEARGAERESSRQAAIRVAVRKADLGDEFAEELITKKRTIEQAREAIIDKFHERNAGPDIDGKVSVETDERSKSGDALERALLARFDARKYPLADGDDARQLVGDSLLEVGRRHLERNGENLAGMNAQQRAAALLNNRVGTRGLHGTSDFPILLANVAGKILRDSYRGITKSFEPITRERSVNDFKEITVAQLGAASRLDQINEHGEYPRGTIGEAAEKYRILKFGKILALTREAMINDDLNAFTRIPQKMGAQAAMEEARIIWAILGTNPLMADGLPLFHVDHGNITTGALDTAGINAAMVAMRLQKDLDGETEIEILPRNIIVPVELATVAKQNVVLQTVPRTPGEANPFQGELGVVDTAYLSKYASDEYYVASSTEQCDMIELAFLQGNREPYFETRDGFDVDGTEIKVRHEIGAAAIDFRGLHKVVPA